MTWTTVALLVGAFLVLSTLVTIGFARWLHIQKTLDERDEAAVLERRRREVGRNWGHHG